MELVEKKRHLAFWTACVPFRLLYAGIAVFSGVSGRWELLRVQSVFTALLMSDMLLRLEKTVGVFGGPAWWIGLRPLHVMCYGGFVLSATLKQQWSGIFLIVDVVIGMIGWHVVRPTFVAPVVPERTQLPILPRHTLRA